MSKLSIAKIRQQLTSDVAKLEKQVNALASKKTLSADEKKLLSSLKTKVRYKSAILVAKDQTLRFLVNDLGIDLFNMSRNYYGKVLDLAEFAITGRKHDFEQSNYTKHFIERILGNEGIDAPFTFTAKDLAQKLGQQLDNGQIKPMTGNTQPYAVIKALEVLTGDTRVSPDTNWRNVTFTLNPDSKFMQKLNKRLGA